MNKNLRDSGSFALILIFGLTLSFTVTYLHQGILIAVFLACLAFGWICALRSRRPQPISK